MPAAVRPGRLGKEFLELTKRHPVRAWTCATCGKRCWYPSIRMPVARPRVNSEETAIGVMECQYLPMCIDCALGREGKMLKKKIQRDEMTPKECWVIQGSEALVVQLGDSNGKV